MRSGAETRASATNASGFSQITAGSPVPRQQEIAKRAIGRRVGYDEGVLKPFRDRERAHALEKRGDAVLVFPPRHHGVDREPRAGFEIRQLEVAAVRQLQ